MRERVIKRQSGTRAANLQRGFTMIELSIAVMIILIISAMALIAYLPTLQDARFDAAMRAPLLKRIAEETGGRFYTAANVAMLPDAISYSGRGVTVVEERDLWDMPIVLLVLMALIGAEWSYRRSRGLA